MILIHWNCFLFVSTVFFNKYKYKIGILERTPRGRKVTRLAYEHLKIPIIENQT